MKSCCWRTSSSELSRQTRTDVRPHGRRRTELGGGSPATRGSGCWMIRSKRTTWTLDGPLVSTAGSIWNDVMAEEGAPLAVLWAAGQKELAGRSRDRVEEPRHAGPPSRSGFECRKRTNRPEPVPLETAAQHRHAGRRKTHRGGTLARFCTANTPATRSVAPGWSRISPSRGREQVGQEATGRRYERAHFKDLIIEKTSPARGT